MKVRFARSVKTFFIISLGIFTLVNLYIYVNQGRIVNPFVHAETLNRSTLESLRSKVKCINGSLERSIKQRGDFWVIHNFIKAEHGPIACYSAVTYTTQGDPTFLDNLVPLIERWKNPVSVAVYAPGSDFDLTVSIIRYLRDCSGTPLIKIYASFHLFFDTTDFPEKIPDESEIMNAYDCTLSAPYNVDINTLYKSKSNLTYPINVARNVARESAITHFVLASDIELYPNPMLSERFLEMIARHDQSKYLKNHVFVISVFEIKKNFTIPNDKTELLEMLDKGNAVPFHEKICKLCHEIPNRDKWLAEVPTEETEVIHVGKRFGRHRFWEPFFISTNREPQYDERLSWEGQSNKMTIGYALCAMDYDMMILNNAFLIHKPGIKLNKPNPGRQAHVKKTNKLKKVILEEMKILFGYRKGCII